MNRKLDWRAPDPLRWRKGGLRQSTKAQHGIARVIYSRDFSAIEGSWQCPTCRTVFPVQVAKCTVCV